VSVSQERRARCFFTQQPRARVSLPPRLVRLLGALPLAMVDWRLAVVVLFALTLDVLVLVGWMMPMFGFWAELVLALPASILIGTLIVFGKKPSRTPLWVCVLARLFVPPGPLGLRR
jgi:hypothetical protein